MPLILDDVPRGAAIFRAPAGVTLTNLLIAALATFLILAGATLFNEALEENGDRINRVVPSWAIQAAEPISRLNMWWAALAAAIAAAIPGKTFLDRIAGPLILLVTTALIYSFLERDFGVNNRGLIIFISLLISQGVLALVYEGGKVWLYRVTYHREAAIRIFPACILIALVSVLLSRVAGFQPGVIIGFVAAAKLLESSSTISVRDHGRALATMGGVLLATAAAAWFIAVPLRDLYEDSPSFWTALPAATAVTIFIVVLEGLLFSLIPLKFIDGSHIWKWNRWIWLALFVPAGMFFAQALFNQDEEYMDLALSHRSLAGVIMLGGYLAVTFGTWAYFTRRAQEAEPPSADPAAPAEAPAPDNPA